MVIKCDFGRLEGRFGALKHEMDINLDDLPRVVHSCFILHNYCEVNGDHISNEAIDKAIKYDREFQPGTTAARNQGTMAIRSKQIHKVFVEYFNNAANSNWPIAKNFQTGSI